MASLIDVSVPIREAMPIWPGNRPVSMALTNARERGDVADVTEVALGAHTTVSWSEADQHVLDSETHQEAP